jgi:hypothetical protein
MRHLNSTKRYLFHVTAIVALVALFTSSFAGAQGSTTVSVVPQMSTSMVDETLSVNVTVSNVQNLFGLELTVNWNASVLQLVTANSRLGVEAYPDGILHGSRLNFDVDSLVAGDIYVEDNSTVQSTGQYHLVAACVGSSDAFSGTGNIVTLAFKVNALGNSAIDIQSELADKPVSGDTSNPIAHADVDGSVEAVIPEFPTITFAGLLVALVTVAAFLTKKRKTNS